MKKVWIGLGITLLVIVMIESQEGVDNIDPILAVPGVDGVFIGPYDMSGSYGIPGQTQHPTIKTACTRVAKACIRAGKAAGIHVVLPSKAAIADAVADGFTFLGIGVDTVFLSEAAKGALTIARNVAAG